MSNLQFLKLNNNIIFNQSDFGSDNCKKNGLLKQIAYGANDIYKTDSCFFKSLKCYSIANFIVDSDPLQ